MATQQQIRDRLYELNRQANRAGEAARDAEHSRQQPERDRLREECAQAGHLWACISNSLSGMPEWQCAVCDLPKPVKPKATTDVFASNLMKAA